MHRCVPPSTTVAVLVAAAVFASACLPRQAGDRAEATAASPSEPAAAEPRLRCAAPPAEALALVPASDARGCGLALTELEGRVALRVIPELGPEAGPEAGPEPSATAAAGEALAVGSPPPECGPSLAACELWAVDDRLGPVLLLAVRGPESGVPVQVYVGWVEQGRLGFAPTWYGLPSVADHTRVGPPWALAPFDCAGELLLLPAPRLPEAAVEGPSAAVRDAGGRWTIPAEGEATLGERRAVDAGECRALAPALP